MNIYFDVYLEKILLDYVFVEVNFSATALDSLFPNWRPLFQYFLYSIELLTSDMCALFFQTTYENFRYRSDGRPNVYDQGCLSNFQEVVFAKIQPSKHKFRAYIQEEVQAPPANNSGEMEEGQVGGPRAKVGDDIDIDDLFKISQRHHRGDNDIEIGGENTN